MTLPISSDELQLNIKSDLVLRVGKICLAAGTGSFRIKQSMRHVAHMLGVENQAHVTLTEINSTCRCGKQFKTEVTNIQGVGINTNNIQLLETLLLDIQTRYQHMSESELIRYFDQSLAKIENQPALYSLRQSALFAAIACSSFTFLIGGGLIEMLGVLIASGFGQALRRTLLHKHLNQFVVTMLAAAVASSLYFLIIGVSYLLLKVNIQHTAGYIASMLFLIPGFPLITGVLDLAKLDFSSGIQRVAYAMTVIFCATFAAWMVAAGIHIAPEAMLTPNLYPVWTALFRLIASFLGVLGFSLLFNSPIKTALTTAFIGMYANTLRLELIDFTNIPIQAAALVAAFVVGISAFYFSHLCKCPRIALSIPAVCIMVPGIYMFRAMYFVQQNDIISAINWGTQAMLIVLALPLGLVLARVCTDKEWAFNQLPADDRR
ncbi:MAG: threonine/serine exporter family protein [Snodgrassella sp.]|uniref:threonine/serine ThrE exporter family protein n=1 Tax=Snodgrassella sp. TaxID=2815304 RepID=UPI0025828A42|nr:threonine/serine exporter family protein [Snodgrassella sp.]MCO6522679.1 threonine/serine exporter family protein [Snodgrassella sp.]